MFKFLMLLDNKIENFSYLTTSCLMCVRSAECQAIKCTAKTLQQQQKRVILAIIVKSGRFFPLNLEYVHGLHGHASYVRAAYFS